MSERYVIDDLAVQAGGYFNPPAKENMAHTECLFGVCEQFGIRYYSVQKRTPLR